MSLLLLAPNQAQHLRTWFVPERPGPLVGAHVLQTGHGACFVDRWPNARAVLAEAAGNYQLCGDPDAFAPDEVRARLVGFVDAPAAFAPLLRAAFPDDVTLWPRVILELPERSPRATTHARVLEPRVALRRLGPEDAVRVWGLSPELAWIATTWGGPAGLAASGCAWGALVDDRLVSLACSFFVGATYEDIGVVTEAGFRRQGLSTACAAALCADISTRGRRPSWTTSLDNTASLGVAGSLGFTLHRHDRLYVVGRQPP